MKWLVMLLKHKKNIKLNNIKSLKMYINQKTNSLFFNKMKILI